MDALTRDKALATVKAAKPCLTAQQYRTLRGQVLAGDSGGAIKGLHKILQKRGSVTGGRAK